MLSSYCLFIHLFIQTLPGNSCVIYSAFPPAWQALQLLRISTWTVMSSTVTLPILRVSNGRHGVVVLTCTSPAEHFPTCLLPIHISSLTKFLFKSFAHFYLACLLSNCWVLQTTHLFWLQALPQICDFHACLHFQVFKGGFRRIDVLNLDAVHYHFSSFLGHAFGAVSKRYLPTFKSQKFYALF